MGQQDKDWQDPSQSGKSGRQQQQGTPGSRDKQEADRRQPQQGDRQQGVNRQQGGEDENDRT